MSGSTLEESLRSLNGAWLLFRQDERGYPLFTVTVDAFWRSFGVFFIILPIFLFSLYVEQQMMETARADLADDLRRDNTLIMVGALALEWVSFPILMAGLARMMKFGHRYVPYIIAYNWSAVIISLMLLPALILYMLGLLPASAAMAINFGVSFFMLYYRWFIARTALQTNGATAAALVAIDFLLSMVISVAAANLGHV